MKIATAPLDYYHQNSLAATKNAGAKVKAENVDFVGFTEVRSKNMRLGLAAGLGPKTYNLQGETHESPVANRKGRWELTGIEIKLGTDGVDGITPNLYLVIGHYQAKKTPRKKVAVISTHLVPLTLGGKKRSKYAERWKMWQEHWAKLKVEVLALLAVGMSVFVIGDFNNTGAAKNIIKQIHPKAKWIIRNGLEWVFAVEGKTKIKRMGLTRAFKTGSDHDAHVRNVILL